MIEQLKKVSIDTKLALYLCQKGSGNMFTIHAGRHAAGELPEWMNSFIQSPAPFLQFEQDGQKKVYLKWVLNANDIIVFMDDNKFTALGHIMNSLLLQSAGQKQAEPAEKASEDDGAPATAQLQKTVEDLKAQNSDLALRLKESLTKEMDLNRELAQFRVKDQQSGASQARSVLTQIKDENGRLTAQIKGWEEKYKKLEEQYKALLSKQGSLDASGGVNEISPHARGLVALINALNNIIVTGDASGIDLQTLGMITSVPSKEELERNPESVKGLIAKLVGMERSGQLTAFQMKRLNNILG